MSAGRIRCAVDGGVWTLTLDRPDRRNALSPALCEKLRAALAHAAAAPGARAIVLEGAGEAAFCAGFDVEALRPDDPDAVQRGNTELYAALDAVASCPLPVVASIAGVAMGAGLELACACDLRVAAEEAVFAMPAARLGVLYRWEGFVRILTAVGPAHAADLFLLGRRVDAARAREMGLVGYVVPAARRRDLAAELAREVAANAPLSVQGAKRMLGRAQATLREVAHEELDALVRRARASEDFAEGRRAFLEKRAPRFSGR